MAGDVEIQEGDALRLLAYLTASADTQLFEPDIYGPFRLVEAASQLAGAVAAGATGDEKEFWATMKTELDEGKFTVLWDRPAFHEFVKDLPARVASEMRERNE